MTPTSRNSYAAPVPPTRGRWRLTAHHRTFVAANWSDTIIAELRHARSRRLTCPLNKPAELTFTIEGHHPEALLVRELATDVVAWRYDEGSANDVIMFRGVVDHSEDELTEQSMATVFTVHDYSAMLQRRYLTAAYSPVQRDQDNLVGDFVAYAVNTSASNGHPFAPGSWLPLQYSLTYPDGRVNRPLSGQLRDRNYTAGSKIYTLLDELGAVIGGFDWGVLAYGGGNQPLDWLAVYYPGRGVERDDVPLVYGSNIAGLTRTVSSVSYANYQRVTGASDPNAPDPATAPPMFAEAWNVDSNNVGVVPVGLWMDSANSPDVSIQSTLDQQAHGNLDTSGLLVPSYTVRLRPGAYSLGHPNLGDTVPLSIFAGRLAVDHELQRVVGLAYAIGDDGQEDVELTLNRSAVTLASLFTEADRDVDALVRR